MGPKFSSITGENGVIIINDTEGHEIDASLIEFSEDAVVDILRYSGSNKNIVSDRITTPSSPTGSNGITPPRGKKFSYIKLSAGTCTLVK